MRLIGMLISILLVSSTYAAERTVTVITRSGTSYTLSVESLRYSFSGSREDDCVKVTVSARSHVNLSSNDQETICGDTRYSWIVANASTGESYKLGVSTGWGLKGRETGTRALIELSSSDISAVIQSPEF